MTRRGWWARSGPSGGQRVSTGCSSTTATIRLLTLTGARSTSTRRFVLTARQLLFCLLLGASITGLWRVVGYIGLGWVPLLLHRGRFTGCSLFFSLRVLLSGSVLGAVAALVV